MNTKHTPGPWKWDIDADTGIATLRTPNGFILRTSPPLQNGFPPTADVALIESSPDLLEACEQSLRALKDLSPACYAQGAVLGDMLRAAIAKARGE